MGAATIPDGIYIGLSFAAYNDDPAIRSHDLMDLLVDPVQWHGENRNPTWRALHPPPEEATAAKAFGAALHCAVLEPGEFDARYYPEPDRPSLPRTKDEIAETMEADGFAPSMPRRGAKREVFVEAARRCGITVYEDWDAHLNELSGERERISPQWFASLQLLQAVIERHSSAPKHLRNGRAEVSLFWTDAHGVRFKVRFDYLRIRTLCDVKSYARRRGRTPIEAFCLAKDDYCYDLSAALYMEARMEVLPRLVEGRRVYSGAQWEHFGLLMEAPLDLPFFEKVAAWREPTWHWIACLTQGVPQVDVIEFPTYLLAFSSAKTQVDIAKQAYRDFRARFGEDDQEMWVAERGDIRLTEANFSMRTLDRGAVKYEVVE
jgi:hypothetical protein